MPEKTKMFKSHPSSGRLRPDFFWVALIACAALLTASPVQARQASLPANSQNAAEPAQLPRILLRAGQREIVAEVASTDATRARGLMFRKHLPADHGMLFVFPEAAQQCFWMKNTPLPLTIAFIDARGRIINLADMQPYSLDSHCAMGPALYALEMEQGWFTRHGIRAGAQIHGLPRVAKGPQQ